MISGAAASPQTSNRIRSEDMAAHRWYRFVLSFPPHLVRDYVERFSLARGAIVLDPFCGTGTTLVECKKLGIESAGIERNPVASFASKVKVDWGIDPESLLAHARHVANEVDHRLEAQGISQGDGLPLFGREVPATALRALPEMAAKLLLRGSISPLPLHKVLMIMDALSDQAVEGLKRHERLALARALNSGVSNLQFGPEVGVGPAKSDAPAVSIWLDSVRDMAEDVGKLASNDNVRAVICQADSREIRSILPPRSVDAVITSPPYPNEKDYTRSTRLESVLLGFTRTKEDLRLLKQGLVRSNTRGVYKSDSDDSLVSHFPEIQAIADAIEQRRIELGKTSGFERMYPRVTRLYFGGMARHLSELRTVLRPGARLAYVVGDQASYLRIMIRTGQLLASIAESLGYEVTGIDLFRTRLSTVTKEHLREEVLLLRWPG